MLTQNIKTSVGNKAPAEHEWMLNPTEQQVHEEQQGRIEEWRLKKIDVYS